MKTKGKSGVMDMTQGNMAMLILSFALPLMLGNVFQQFYTVADTAIVGKILGVDALAALGTVESINWLVLGTIQGITQGFGILVSQQFGAKKEEALQETIFHASFLAVVAAILFTVGILIGLSGLVGILQVPVDIRPICLDYLYVLFGGIPLMMLYNFTAAMLRAFGDSKTPLTACVIAALFNIALDLYFILELGWGVKGAALATVIAQTLASAYCLCSSPITSGCSYAHFSVLTPAGIPMVRRTDPVPPSNSRYPFSAIFVRNSSLVILFSHPFFAFYPDHGKAPSVPVLRLQTSGSA